MRHMYIEQINDPMWPWLQCQLPGRSSSSSSSCSCSSSTSARRATTKLGKPRVRRTRTTPTPPSCSAQREYRRFPNDKSGSCSNGLNGVMTVFLSPCVRWCCFNYEWKIIPSLCRLQCGLIPVISKVICLSCKPLISELCIHFIKLIYWK